MAQAVAPREAAVAPWEAAVAPWEPEAPPPARSPRRCTVPFACISYFKTAGETAILPSLIYTLLLYGRGTAPISRKLVGSLAGRSLINHDQVGIFGGKSLCVALLERSDTQKTNCFFIFVLRRFCDGG